MTNEEFAYWISGYLALSTEESFSEKQVSIIKNHAALVQAVEGKLNPAIESLINLLEKKLQRGCSPLVSDLKEYIQQTSLWLGDMV